jgi:2-succinyl-6-hydroxy-2,4-cyclohexadiene-1-carboxylate synthase
LILAFKTHGNESKPPLIFLHGFLGCKEDWNPLIESLKKDYFCVTIDLPGHGHSILNPEDTVSFKQTIEGVYKIYSDLRLGLMTLIGYSMGGRVAMGYASAYPLSVDRLIIESSFPGYENQKDKERRLETDFDLAEELEAGSMAQFLDKWYRFQLFKSLREHPTFSLLKKGREQNDPIQVSKALKQLSSGLQPSYWSLFGNGAFPIYYVTGEWDKKYCLVANKIKDRYPQCNITIISKAGHNVHFEQQSSYLTWFSNTLFKIK